MLRLQQRFISFSIVSHKIAHNVKDYKRDPTLNFYPVVGLKDIKLGTISLNQGNNQNFLTIQMIDELFRFLNSYHHDHSVQNIWIQNRGSMFMGGISYFEMFQNPDYLDKLYKMTAMLAKLNKPIFACATGGVRNVGAYVLSMAAVALTDCSSSLRIDEVSKGFVPVAGGTHRLSRIPANIGFYLALTGTKLSSDQMSRLGLITAVVKQGISSKQMRHSISRSNLYFREKLKSFYKDQRKTQWMEWNDIQKKKAKLKTEIQLDQTQILSNKDNVFERFTMNQYKIAQINYENSKKPFNSFTQKPGRKINNYFRLRHQKAFNYLQKNGFVEKNQIQDIRFPRFEIDKIVKVFRQDTLLQSIKVLQADPSQWAKQTLTKLRQMDPLASIITFEMLKNAQDLSFDQCLQMQYTVAKRILANSKLVLKQTYAGSKYVLVNNYSDMKIEEIPYEQVIEQYLSPAITQEETFEKQLPLYSLYPTVDYLDIPDSARLCLNQQFFDDIHIGNQHRQVRRWLENEKIDYRHKSYDINLLRQKIYTKWQYESVQLIQSKRLEVLLNNYSAINNYMQERHNYIDQISDQALSKYLKQTATEVFNDGVRTRYQDLNKTAAVIGKQRKLQIFKNLRKTLVKQIVINGLQVEDLNRRRLQNFGGLVYFDKKGRSIYQSKNPNLQLIQPLNKLTNEISQKRELSQQFIQNQGTQVVDSQIGIKPISQKRQIKHAGIREKIAKRYQENPQYWQRAYQYEIMMKQASKTSQELAQYLQWDSSAYYATISNAPSQQKTYAQVGQKYIDRINEQNQQLKQQLKGQIELNNTISGEYFEMLYDNNKQLPLKYKSSQFLKSEIFSKLEISQQIEKFLIPTIDSVMRHFEEKYYESAKIDKKIQFGEFDQFVYQQNDKQFIQKYKNDILFVFSYFSILKIKDVLHVLKTNGVPDNDRDIRNFFKQHHIEFYQDRTLEFINKIISKFLFQMLDLHTYTKSKIHLPQSKLLDFMNRFKIAKQTNKKSTYPLSFESLLLMIGKDRTKLYNKVLHQYIPTQPQYILEAAHFNTNNILDSQEFLRGSQTSLLHLTQNAVGSQHLQRKTLISGYEYYLGLFDSFIQRASGKYNFVNDQILSLNPQELKKQMRNIMNLKESAQQWFQRNGRQLLKQFFNARIQFEKNLTKGQLYALDQDFKEILTPETFRLALKYALQSQIQQSKQYFRFARHYSYELNDSELNEDAYCNIRRSVKNPQAFKRLNNLKMAMNVRRDYIIQKQDKLVSQEQKEDLVQQRKEFTNYERFPAETYKRMTKETFSYGEQKNFDKYLNPLKDKQMDHKQYSKNLRFADDYRATQFKTDEKFTQFTDEIKALKETVFKNTKDTEIDSIYKKLEELL